MENLTFAIKKSSGVTKPTYFVCCVMYVMMAICLLIRFNLKKLNKPNQREVSILQLGYFLGIVLSCGNYYGFVW